MWWAEASIQKGFNNAKWRRGRGMPLTRREEAPPKLKTALIRQSSVDAVFLEFSGAFLNLAAPVFILSR